MLLCHMFLYRVEYVDGILVFTKKNDSHKSIYLLNSKPR